MKKALLIVLGLVAFVAVALPLFRIYTKSHSPAAVASFDQGGLSIRVKYCQPAKKGREIFGQLVPFGKIWRTGANEATQITFGQDVRWGETIVKAGTYTLFTEPGPTQWKAILNREAEQWGAYNYDAGKNAAQTIGRVEAQAESTELFTISFAPAAGGADLLLVWDKTKVVVPIRK